MKKCWMLAVLMLCLTGCGAQETFETLGDEIVQSAAALQQTVSVILPDGAVTDVMETASTGKLYLCDGYSVTVQTLEAGDLDRTLRTVTGFSRDALTVMQTQWQNTRRYECVWSAAGEAEDQVGRAVILDDGCYHYAVSVMAPSSKAGGLADTWQSLFDSVRLGNEVNTGS